MRILKVAENRFNSESFSVHVEVRTIHKLTFADDRELELHLRESTVEDRYWNFQKSDPSHPNGRSSASLAVTIHSPVRSEGHAGLGSNRWQHLAAERDLTGTQADATHFDNFVEDISQVPLGRSGSDRLHND